MKKVMKILAGLAGLLVFVVLVVILLTPWMDRWGTTDADIQAVFPGDKLVPNPVEVVNRAITIYAAPEQIYPWLVQMGADRGGMYSYTALETLINCPQVNADRIHPEWQNLQAGDEVKMCQNDPAPPPYIVAELIPNQAVIMGHHNNQGEWEEVWQFILLPQADGSTRLIQRTRTMMAGGLWSIIHPGVFFMERGMMLGIKERRRSELIGLLSLCAGSGCSAYPQYPAPARLVGARQGLIKLYWIGADAQKRKAKT